ncbi:MAG: excinuclease ABC subunit UvrC [Lachnospiraceae bacterium]
MSDFNVTEELKKLPDKPGVYLMHDKNDTIIYVGKAVNLKNRVRSYFREKIGRGPKIDKMVTLIDRFEYIITDTELEALVLENNLIKEYRPKYNTMLMDDKTYPYIKVTVFEEYPRILFSREMKKDKAKYFGPYTNAGAVKDTIDLINKLYGLRTCNRHILQGTKAEQRACLNYHIGQCCAPCRGDVSAEDYRQRMNGALQFLNGDYGPIQKELKEKMLQASEAMEYEEAMKYRDLLESVMAVSQKQKIEDSAQDDKDIIALARDEKDAVVQIFFVRNGRMTGREHFYMTNIDSETNAFILSSFVRQFYGGTPFIPRNLMLSEEIEDGEIIGKWLSEKKGQKVYLWNPKKGQKEKMVELAAKNAALVLQQDREKIKREEAKTIGAVHELEKLLDLPNLVRMEAFDISNISGFENVASMVVYEKGKPKKSDYRKFKIKTVSGPDDYACMREVLKRRFEHAFRYEKYPDLLLMDGGRGQVNIALEVMEEIGISIPVCGMVKDDRHRTRGLYFNNRELPIDIHSEGFKLVTRIQDEAHRFAITYHRSLRTRDQVHSVLDDIPGVGPKRRRALMKAFDSLEEIREASLEELMQKGEMPKNAAKAIYDYFQNKS